MGRKILVIDDDAAIHRVLVQHLSNAQTEVQSAENGESGVALAKQCKPDLILLDVDMPGINGHEVCRRLKFDPETQGIPIAFLTSAGTVDDRVAGLDHGAFDYIVKPFDPCEVAARTRAAFRTKSTIEMVASRTMLDTLTSLGNRAAFEQHLRAELARAHRVSEPLACVMVEPDRLDEMIKSDGPAVYDSVLCDIATILQETCREEDRIFRYSTRRFAIVAPNLAASNIMIVADRLRTAVDTYPSFRNRLTIRPSVSVGAAVSRFSVGRTVVDEAIEALCRARLAGGDTIMNGGELTELRLAA